MDAQAGSHLAVTWSLQAQASQAAASGPQADSVNHWY